MISLSELQSEFIASMRDLAAGNIVRYLSYHPKFTATDQLSLYQTSVIATLQKALKAIYPTCLKLVGEDFFIAMMNSYIDVTPSTSHDLNLYGESFANFIQQFEPANSLPYLSDVAHLEWAWHRVYSAPDYLPFDFGKLAASYANDPQKLIFLLPPASVLLSAPFPTHLIYETNLDSYQGDTTITLKNNESYYYLIWRNQLDRQMDVLSAIQWHLLSWIQASCTLGEICEKAAVVFPDIEIAKILPELVSKGWISGVS
ncbi:MAG: DNA-binding domain-containing protein [Gammaproteobacteria bacterium]|nr:DNA-binding domain-containing protein [Gammaproteobacteria bacterium]